jgi:hypothetical protein
MISPQLLVPAAEGRTNFYPTELPILVATNGDSEEEFFNKKK